MRKSKLVILCVALMATAVVAAGCNTYAQSGLAGAGAGAAAGALIAGDSKEGALAGAALGALTGLIVHDVKARKAKKADETAKEYDYQPTQGELMTFEEAKVLPSVVNRGHMAEASLQYALLGTGGGVEVKETRVLKRGDEVIAQLSSQTHTRNDGTWVSAQPFRVAEKLPPGEYTVVQTAQTNQSAVSGQAKFYVE